MSIQLAVLNLRDCTPDPASAVLTILKNFFSHNPYKPEGRIKKNSRKFIQGRLRM